MMSIRRINNYITKLWYHKEFKFARYIINVVCTPFVTIYYTCALLRWKYCARKQYKSKLFTICVGNLTCGGEGKTPVVRHIMNKIANANKHDSDQLMIDIWTKIAIKLGSKYFERSREENKYSNDHFRACVVLRGYRGIGTRKNMQSSIDHYPDESTLLKKDYRVFISADRKQGFKVAEDNNYDIIVMDDGYQNYSVHKDYNILVFSMSRKLDNQWLLPSGPLRETFERGGQRADAILIIDDTYEKEVNINEIVDYAKALKKKINRSYFRRCNSINAEYFYSKAYLIDSERLNGKRCMLITGISNPNKVRAAVESAGCKMINHHIFEDHHEFNAREIELLIADYEHLSRIDEFRRKSEDGEDKIENHKLIILTTEKDESRLRHAVMNWIQNADNRTKVNHHSDDSSDYMQSRNDQSLNLIEIKSYADYSESHRAQKFLESLVIVKISLGDCNIISRL